MNLLSRYGRQVCGSSVFILASNNVFSYSRISEGQQRADYNSIIRACTAEVRASLNSRRLNLSRSWAREYERGVAYSGFTNLLLSQILAAPYIPSSDKVRAAMFWTVGETRA